MVCNYNCQNNEAKIKIVFVVCFKYTTTLNKQKNFFFFFLQTSQTINYYCHDRDRKKEKKPIKGTNFFLAFRQKKTDALTDDRTKEKMTKAKLKLIFWTIGVCIVALKFYFFHLSTHRKLSKKIYSWNMPWCTHITDVIFQKIWHELFITSLYDCCREIVDNDNITIYNIGTEWQIQEYWTKIKPCSVVTNNGRQRIIGNITQSQNSNLINGCSSNGFLFSWVEQQRDIIANSLSIPIYTEAIFIHRIKFKHYQKNTRISTDAIRFPINLRGVPGSFPDFTLLDSEQLKQSKKMNAHRVKIYMHLNISSVLCEPFITYSQRAKNNQKSIYPIDRQSLFVKRILAEEPWPHLSIKNCHDNIINTNDVGKQNVLDVNQKDKYNCESIVVIFYTRPTAIVGL